MENDVAQQSADMPHSDQDSKAQRSEVDESLSESRLELTRMDQSVATESNRPMYPPPGLDDPNHETEHPAAPTTTITGHQNNSRRPIPGRRRALSLRHPQQHRSHLKTAPVAHWIWTRYQRTQTRQDFQRTSWPRTSEFPVTPSPEREVLGPTDSSETMPGVSSEISNAAIESVNRNRMLDFGKDDLQDDSSRTRRRERKFSFIGRASCKPFGETWYYLIPDPSGALVSEVVDRKDLALERPHIPGHHFTPTGPTDGHNNEFGLCDG